MSKMTDPDGKKISIIAIALLPASIVAAAVLGYVTYRSMIYSDPSSRNFGAPLVTILAPFTIIIPALLIDLILNIVAIVMYHSSAEKHVASRTILHALNYLYLILYIVGATLLFNLPNF